MQTYLYKVKDHSGRLHFGLTEGRDAQDVKKQFLSSEYYYLLASPYSIESLQKIRLSHEELLMFTRRLSYLIETGVPILHGLHILWRQSEDKDVQIMVSYIRKKLEDGGSLQEAFEAFPRVFNQMYLALIGVAEIGAGLVKILRKLCEYLEEQKKFIARLKRATLYPVFVVVFAILVVIGLFTFVVPTFQKVILKLHAKIPVLTQLLFAFSNLLRNPYFIVFVILLIVGGIFLWNYLRKVKRIDYVIDSWKLKAPLLKDVMYPLLIGRFTRSLSLLIGSGVPLIKSLEVAKATSDNAVIEAKIEEIRLSIMEGGTLYEAFKASETFPIIMIELMGIGEISGKLQSMLETIAAHLEEEADYALNKYLTYLEPVLIIFVGGMVLCVLLGIYLPILSLQSALRTM